MACFGDYQHEYAARGIATFPFLSNVADKRPLTCGYARVGLKGSERLALKFPDAPGIACMAGRGRVKLTIADVDARGAEAERLLSDIQCKYGRAKVIARTGRGGYHAYYRHNGEGRKIRAEAHIDILGGGIVVLPPSRGLQNDYEFIEGGIDDLAALTPMRVIAPSIIPLVEPDRHLEGEISEGGRNVALFQHSMRSAHHCDDFAALLDVARTRNEDFLPPLDDGEVMKIAKSAWGYTERGENRFAQTGAWLPTAEVNSLIAANPDGFMLLTFLRANNGPRSTFVVANGLKDTFGWKRERMAKARCWLEENGYLAKVRNASKQNGAALYRWSHRKGGKREQGERVLVEDRCSIWRTLEGISTPGCSYR